MAKKQAEVASEQTVEQKLMSLFQLQEADSKIDEIKRLRGELPLEVKDLEDELAGLETRIAKIQDEITQKEKDIVTKKEEIKDAQEQVKRYEEQQMDVRNNREFDAIAKEIEFQKLNIELFEKRIREYTRDVENRKEQLETANAKHADRKLDLDAKETELNTIINETKAEEDHLKAESENISRAIDERLLNAYSRLRKNARNGVAVATVERDACGGCFNKIPPQRQLDIKSHKKIIVCEYCGRILVDKELAFGENAIAE
ncbi:MAG: C4-type zinc ribbon domain-containing protein [Bacteroidales bacterium]|nr:C4-type zinc ribbon domain-containing protein [Bacteroidales bacterium]